MLVVELVRHARALPRAGWDADDRERPLTPSGERQAEALAAQLGGEGPAALLSSPFRRCLQTLAPLGAVLGLPVVGDERLAEFAGLPPLVADEPWLTSAWLAGRALEVIGEGGAEGRMVLCTHGDVASALLTALAARDGLDLPSAPLRKGALVRLELQGGRVRHAEALPAPA